MRIHSLSTVAASLMLVLAFVFMFNMVSSNQLEAHPKVTGMQDKDGSFDPIQEESSDENSEEWEEEGEPSDDDHADEDYEDEDHEGEEHEHEEAEHEFMYLELEKLSIENNLVRLEFMNRMTEIAKDDEATAAYAIMHLGEFMEEDEVIDTLEKLHDSGVSGSTRNLIRMKLAEAYMEADRHEKSMEILKLMITGATNLEK